MPFDRILTETDAPYLTPPPYRGKRNEPAYVLHVAEKVAVSFTGDTAAGSLTISNVSDFTGLFTGIGVVGPAIPSNTAVSAMDPTAHTITLSQEATAAGTGATFDAGFLTVTRRVKWWSETDNQPALGFRHTADEDHFGGGILSDTTIEGEFWIYSRAGADPDEVPDTWLNNLCKAVRLALAPDDSHQHRFTIGGLCHWCRIEGRSEYDDGALDGQSKATLPVKITLP